METELAASLALALRATPDSAEQTVLTFDGACYAMDRKKASLNKNALCKGIQGGRVPFSSHLTLKVYLDRSMVEACVNHWALLTTRTYPTRSDALGLALSGAPGQRISRLDIYEMKPCF